MDPTWVAVAEGLDTDIARRAQALLEGQEIRCAVEGGRILVPPGDVTDAHVVLSALAEEDDLGGREDTAAVDEATLTAAVNEQRLPGMAADALVMALRSVGIPAKTDGPGASRGSEIGVMPEVRVLVAPEDLEAARRVFEHAAAPTRDHAHPHDHDHDHAHPPPTMREDPLLGASLGTDPPTGPSSTTLLALFAVLAVVAVLVMKSCV